jgi:hypothetical protein
VSRNKHNPNYECTLKQLGLCDPQTCECLKLDRAHQGADSGAAQLMLAVLRRGVSDYVLYRSSPDAQKRELGADAASWIFDLITDFKTATYIYSFESVCGAFNISPHTVRKLARTADAQGIRRLRGTNPESCD